MSVTTSGEAVRALQHENIRLKDQNGRLNEQVRSLRGAIHAMLDLENKAAYIGEDTDVVGLISSVLQLALQAVQCEDGSLQLFDPERYELMFAAVIGASAYALRGYRIPANEGIAGKVLESGVPMLVPDVRKEQLWSPMVDRAVGFKTLSLLSVPVVVDGRVAAVIEVVNPTSGEPFTQQDLDILSLVSIFIARVLKAAEEVSVEQDAAGE